jgi:phage terminase large subunit-like protein
MSNLVDILAELKRRQTEGGVFERFFVTEADRANYPHWMDFFAAGKNYHERLALCANQVGKTTAALTELTYHLTGEYPRWWVGHRYDGCQTWWVCGTSQKDVKDVLQERLLGPVGDFGTGFIPKHLLDFDSLKDAKKAETPITSFRVLHKTGAMSTVTFKSYEQGREAFQGKPGISVLLDEEPPLAVYTEALMRTIAGNNRAMLTFTPLKGISETVLNFLGDGDIMSAHGELAPSRYLVRASWDNTPHLTEAKKAALMLTIPEFQRDARMKGIPSLGSGAIFPVAESTWSIEPFEIPKHWARCYGFDVGRNTAAMWIAYDRESATYYTYAEAFQVEGAPSAFAASIQARGKWIRGAIDTAARGRGATDGQNLYQMYQDLGLHIQNADKAVEAGLFHILDLLIQGRLKVFNTCKGFIEEMRMYRRDEKGNIVKARDHRMDAWRYALFTADKILWTEAEANAVLNPAPYEYNPPQQYSDSWMAQ